MENFAIEKNLNLFQINLMKNVVFFSIVWYDKDSKIKWGRMIFHCVSRF